MFANSARPPQQQDQQPGLEAPMKPQAVHDRPEQAGANKLKDQVALISGGDSGIGRAAAIAFAKEGADVAIMYLNETPDAEETKKSIEGYGRQCLLLPGDIGDSSFCDQAVQRVIETYGKLDIVVNNAAEQHLQDSLLKITDEQLERTFRTNIFSYFYLTRSALKHLKEGARIINTTSVTAYRGSAHLLDYSSTKGAIVSFTRSLALSLAQQKIRVNGVAPGPVWTPLIPASFPADQVANFGSDVPLGHAGEPVEIAPAFVFLASDDSSFMTGQVLHPNGGEIING